MSQKRKRSRSSVSCRRSAKRYRAARDDSYHGTGRSHRFPANQDNSRSPRYNNKNNYRHCSRSTRKRRRFDDELEKNNRIYEKTRKSNRRNYERKYNQRNWSKWRYSTRSRSSRSSYYSSSRSSSSGSSSRSSSSSSTATEVQRSSSVPNDKNGHLICKPGDKINNRYVVSSVLGEGTFGRVIECVDLFKEGERVAMKVVRNVRRYREAAKLEVNVLNTLNKNDPLAKNHCIHMLDSFQFHGHMCITFAKLGDSVFEFLKKNDFQCFDIDQVCQMSFQLCKSVLFMHRNNLTHTDLKPENILFKDSTSDFLYPTKSKKPLMKVRCANIELIDFGSATFDHEHHSSVVSTRHYRAPEVVLELGWSHPCDVWSIGCIMFELYTGNTLFQTHDNLEHMAMMERILGPLPSHLVHNTSRSKYFYKGKLDWDDESTSGKYVKQHCKNLKRYMKGNSEEEGLFFDLISCMLDYSEDRRITLSTAIKHPFFKKFASSTACNSQSVHRSDSYQTFQNTSWMNNGVIKIKSSNCISMGKRRSNQEYKDRVYNDRVYYKRKEKRSRSRSESEVSSRYFRHSSPCSSDYAHKDYDDAYKYNTQNSRRRSRDYSNRDYYNHGYKNRFNSSRSNNSNKRDNSNKKNQSWYKHSTYLNYPTSKNYQSINPSVFYDAQFKGNYGDIDRSYKYFKHYPKEINNYYDKRL